MTSAKNLREITRIIKRRYGFELDIDHMTGQGYRIQLGERDISPRMGAREMLRWLEGFLEGLETTDKWWRGNEHGRT